MFDFPYSYMKLKPFDAILKCFNIKITQVAEVCIMILLNIMKTVDISASRGELTAMSCCVQR